jgi:hypothetical protein
MLDTRCGSGMSTEELLRGQNRNVSSGSGPDLPRCALGLVFRLMLLVLSVVRRLDGVHNTATSACALRSAQRCQLLLRPWPSQIATWNLDCGGLAMRMRCRQVTVSSTLQCSELYLECLPPRSGTSAVSKLCRRQLRHVPREEAATNVTHLAR